MNFWKNYGILTSLIIVGVLLIVIANASKGGTPPTTQPAMHWWDTWPSWLETLGTTLFIAGSLGVIERVFARKDTLRDIGELFQLHESTSRLGLTEISLNAGNYDYSELIRRSPSLHIVMNDARTWVFSRIDQFQERFSHKEFETEVFLVDPQKQFARVIAEKTGYTLEGQQAKIAEAVNRFRGEFESAGKRGVLRIYYLKYFPTYCVVSGADVAVFTLYGNSSGRRKVPTFRVRKTDNTGDIFQTLEQDIENLRKEATLAYDSTPQELAKPLSETGKAAEDPVLAQT